MRACHSKCGLRACAINVCVSVLCTMLVNRVYLLDGAPAQQQQCDSTGKVKQADVC